MLNFKDFYTSIVRTIVPVAVGAILTWAATHNVPLDSGFAGSLRLVLEALLTGSYYIGVRLFEHYVSPKFGWLLGLAKSPDYTEKFGSNAVLGK